jgi:hypothetical protein
MFYMPTLWKVKLRIASIEAAISDRTGLLYALSKEYCFLQ